MADQKKSGKKKSGKSTKAKADALVDDLSTQVQKLAKQLKIVENERDALEAKLYKRKAKTKRAIRDVEKKARKELKKVRDAVEPALENVASAAADVAPDAVPAAGRPDDSWTVTRLRAEARAQDVTGYSRMSKAQLITILG